MDEADQEKTSFITSQGLYCYKVMPFGLKNARVTYQRLVNHMFHPQIGRNLEVYVNDMLVKSLEEGKHLDDLQASVLSEFRQESSWGSWFRTEELKQIQTKFRRY